MHSLTVFPNCSTDILVLVRNGEQETTYYYTYNLQGDIIGILDSSGNAVVNYTYTAWGEIDSVSGSLAETVGKKNPLRYRGYYYDSETGFYYLQSRYYDPITQRFLNADGYVSTGQGILGNNMFAYCGNNPVIYSDPGGDIFGIDDAAIFATVYVLVAVTAAVMVYVAGKTATRYKPPAPALPNIRDIASKAKNFFKSHTNDYTKAKPKEEIQTLPKAPKKDPVHHIVAQNDRRAEESRKILRDVGIEPVTDLRNLVVLPQSYHASLHTNADHSYVTERLRLVAGDKAGVEATLASLKAEILACSVAGIRWD